MPIDPALLTATTRRHNLAALIASMTAASLIYGMSTPLISLVLDDLGTSSELIGLTGTAQALVGLPMAPLVARMMRLWGPARPILLGLSITTIMYLLLPIHPDVWMWLPLRLCLAAAGAMLWITGEAWVNQVADHQRRGRVLALYSMALGAGGALGPLLLAGTGSDGWLPFLIMAGVTAVSIVPVVWVRRSVPSMTGKPVAGVLGYLRLAPIPILICGLYAIMDGIIMTFLPLYGLRLGLGAEAGLTFLTMLSIGGIAGQVPAGWLADHVDRNRLVLAATVVLIGGTALIPFAMASLVWGSVLFLLYGAVRNGLYTVGMAMLGTRFSGADLASASAAFGVAWVLGMVLGPSIGGFVMDALPRLGIPVAIGALLLLFLPLPIAAELRRGQGRV